MVPTNKAKLKKNIISNIGERNVIKGKRLKKSKGLRRFPN